MLGSKKGFGSNEIAGPKMLGPENILGLKKMLVQKKFGLKKFDPKNFGPQKFIPPKIRSKKFAKNQTAEIVLLWKNVARIYVTWTNATMTVGIF